MITIIIGVKGSFTAVIKEKEGSVVATPLCLGVEKMCAEKIDAHLAFNIGIEGVAVLFAR